MQENRHLCFFFSVLYILLGATALWLIFKYIIGWLTPFIIAFLVSKIINRPVDYCENTLNFPRPLASGFFTLSFYGVLIISFYWAISRLISESGALLELLGQIELNSTIERIMAFFRVIIKNFPTEIQAFISNNIENWGAAFVNILKEAITKFASFATDIATKLPSLLVSITVTIVSTFFLSCDYALIKEKLTLAISRNRKLCFSKTQAHISHTFTSYIKAFILLILITFAELTLGFMLLKIPHPILIASITALIDALPILGTGFILIPWALISVFAHNFALAIGLALLYAIITITRNIIEPKIIGKQIGLHPLVTLISVYIGLKVFGLIGVFMPIPITLCVQFYKWGYFDFLTETFKSEKRAK